MTIKKIKLKKNYFETSNYHLKKNNLILIYIKKHFKHAKQKLKNKIFFEKLINKMIVISKNKKTKKCFHCKKKKHLKIKY